MTDEYMLLDGYYDCMDYGLMEKLNLMALEAAITDDDCKKRLAGIIRKAYPAAKKKYASPLLQKNEGKSSYQNRYAFTFIFS